MKSQPRTTDAVAPALHRLGRLAALDADAVAAIEASAQSARWLTTRSELMRAGQPVGVPLLLLDGWAARTQVLLDGRRQILDFKLPGDVIGWSAQADAIAPVTMITLTSVLVCPAPPADAPSLRAAYAASLERDEALLLNQIARVGRMNAAERLDDLFLELFERLQLCGRATGNSCPLPLTQEVLADALGLTPVHLNRVLQAARREDKVRLRSGMLELPDPDVLRRHVGRSAPRIG